MTVLAARLMAFHAARSNALESWYSAAFFPEPRKVIERGPQAANEFPSDTEPLHPTVCPTHDSHTAASSQH